MRLFIIMATAMAVAGGVLGFWDDGTTTAMSIYDEEFDVQQSFFRWQWTLPLGWFNWYDDHDNGRRRWLTCVCGLSIDFLQITTGVILNMRTVVTAANPLEPFQTRMGDLRIWALGRTGQHYTPYRYRVWQFRRVLPKSMSDEHQSGPRGRFCFRHDVAVVTSRDQMYLEVSFVWLYAKKGWLIQKKETFDDNIYYVGSGFERQKHVRENYKIYYHDQSYKNIVNCEKYVPKFWGKHICFYQNSNNLGIQNGGGLFTKGCVIGIGAFEIRYNEDRVSVFTDLRYYVDWINTMANITPGAYYDYTYQQWGVMPSWWFFQPPGGVTRYYAAKYVGSWGPFWPLGK